MIRKLFFLRDKSDILSFWGGIVSSFSCTIMYESVVGVSSFRALCTMDYLFQCISAICFMVCCVLFLNVSSKVKELDAKYELLFSLGTNTEKSNPMELFVLAMERCLKEKASKELKQRRISTPSSYASRLYWIFIVAWLMFIVAFIMLILAQVVK